MKMSKSPWSGSPVVVDGKGWEDDRVARSLASRLEKPLYVVDKLACAIVSTWHTETIQLRSERLIWEAVRE